MPINIVWTSMIVIKCNQIMEDMYKFDRFA